MLSRKAKLAAWLSERAPAPIELTDLEELRQLLAPTTESELRHLLRLTGASLHPLVAGVDQSSFVALGNTLVALADGYESGDAETRKLTRQIVITAKDHAKLVARNLRVAEEKRQEKSEMVAWMLTWLENPLVFPVWLRLRQQIFHRNLG